VVKKSSAASCPFFSGDLAKRPRKTDHFDASIARPNARKTLYGITTKCLNNREKGPNAQQPCHAVDAHSLRTPLLSVRLAIIN
jgi:hypothetical protein